MTAKHQTDYLGKHRETILIPPDKAEKMRNIIKGEEQGSESVSAEFDDGFKIIIQCLSETPEDDDRDGYPAASALLLKPDGTKITRTPPFGSFWNKWRISYNDVSYGVDVRPE